MAHRKISSVWFNFSDLSKRAWDGNSANGSPGDKELGLWPYYNGSFITRLATALAGKALARQRCSASIGGSVVASSTCRASST